LPAAGPASSADRVVELDRVVVHELQEQCGQVRKRNGALRKCIAVFAGTPVIESPNAWLITTWIALP